MKTLNISLEHCYGIKKMQHTFDFSNTETFAIYAPNGSMKTSLAETFKDIAEERKSKDRLFPSRKTTRRILDEDGLPLTPAHVLGTITL